MTRLAVGLKWGPLRVPEKGLCGEGAVTAERVGLSRLAAPSAPNPRAPN